MRKLILLSMVSVFCIVSAALAGDEKKLSEIPIGVLSDFEEDTVKLFSAHKIIVFKDKDGIYCVSSACTHKGCALSFKKKEKIFACPCHGANFSESGEVIRGPAKKGLEWYGIRLLDGGRLVVDKDTVVPAGTKFKFDN